jgi:hypothetical protein
MLRWKRDILTRFLAIAQDPALWWVRPRIPFFGEPFLPVRRQNMIDAITQVYVDELMESGKRFDRSELSRRIKEFQDESEKIKEAMQDELDETRSEIVKLEEAQAIVPAPRARPAPRAPAPEPPPARSSRVCVEFQRATREGVGSLASLEGKIHVLRNTWQSPRGWQGSVTMEWTAPPEQICDGDPFTFTSTVRNHQPAKDTATAARLNFRPVSGLDIEPHCDNPDRWDPIYDVPVMASEQSRSNRCTVKLRITGFSVPKPLFLADLSAGQTGFIYYYYKRVE